MNQGSLCPALHRLEHQGWIAAKGGFSNMADEREATTFTPAGKKQLQRETETWGQARGRDRSGSGYGLT